MCQKQGKLYFRTIHTALLILFFGYLHLHGQDYSFEHINVEEGLSQSTVNAIIQDNKGFMWFGTNDGLDTYNGYEIASFRNFSNDSLSLNKNTILSLYEDQEGIIWIGTYGGGINRFDVSEMKFRHYTHDPQNKNSLSNDQVFEIFEDSRGLFWIGTEQGTDLFDPGEQRFTSLDDQAGISIGKTASITEDWLGDIWIAGANGIFRYHRESRSLINCNPEKRDETTDYDIYGWEVYVDKKGDLWAGIADKLAKFDYPKNEFRIYSLEQISRSSGQKIHVRRIFEDKTNTFWLGTDGEGLMIFDREEEDFYLVPNDQDNSKNFNGDVVTSICEDSTGNLWFGTFKSGVNKLDRFAKRFFTYRHERNNPNSLIKSDVKAVYQDEDGTIWVGTEKGGLSRINRLTGEVETFLQDVNSKTSLPSNVVLSISRDNKGRLWIGTYGGGLCEMNTETGQFSRFLRIPDELNNQISDVIWDIFPDEDGKIWVGSWGAGLQLLDPATNRFENYSIVEEGLKSNNSVLSIAKDYQGFIWVGTYGDGLKRINPVTKETKHFRHIEEEEGSLTDDMVHVVYEDSERNIWVGTKEGLDLYDRKNEVFIHFTTENGLPNNVINGILEDQEKNLWISTNQGITKFNPFTATIRNYNLHDGLQGDEFNRGVCFTRNSEELIFGGVNGLNIFRPEDIVDNPNVPDVYFTSLKIRNKDIVFGEPGSLLQKPVSELDTLVLPYDFSVLTLEFVGLNYTKPEKNQYAWFLENYDESWSYMGSRRTATYTNLNPGEYEFFVKAANNDGLWNEEGTSLTLIITPPYWKTWWFQTIVVFVVWGALSLLFMLRTRMIKKQKEELEVLVDERTHELRLQKAAVESKNRELELQKREIERQRDQVREMTRKVLESEQMKLRFFTNISHEFRTPLTLILGPVEKLLNTSSLRDEFHNQLSLVHRNALRLLRLVNEILDFRKIDKGRLKLRVTQNNLAAFVQDVYFSFNELARRKKINYVFNCSDDLLDAWFDYDKLEKVLFNLIANAFKFTPPQGEIQVITSRKSVVLFENQPEVLCAEIRVKDNGRGISEEHLSRIFDRFYQVEAGNSTNWQGSGIGLSFTKSLVDIHRGKIEVKSKKWNGTEFIVTLPITREVYSKSEIVDSEQFGKDELRTQLESTDRADDGLQYEENNTDESGKPLVLLIEDNEDLRFYIRDEISHEFSVLEAGNGEEGLNVARSREVDLIVSDIMMPEMDGLELCRKIKSDLHTSHIPVILLTARTTDDYKLKGLEYGADDYVFKPFNATILLARIKNLIESRRMLKIRFSKEPELSPRDVTVTSPDETFLSNSLRIVEDNISDSEFNVDKLVREVGMSRSVFYRKLKHLTGQSANDFIKSMRMKRAAQILRQNKLSVSEVSYEVGFNDPQYFSKCFKEQYGKTPTQYVNDQTTGS